MKKHRFPVFTLVLLLSLPACTQQAETALSSNELAGQSLASFSYEEDAAAYKDGDPGVNPNEFVNVDVHPIESQDAAVERAKSECTIEYNATSASYDESTDMWRIHFFTAAARQDDALWVTVGGGQSVYMNSDGITQLIVYGE